MGNTAIVGINWGDEGKGRMVDLLIEYLDGWKCDISGVRRWEDLPEAARKYVEFVEAQIGCHIGYVSVGPERRSIILR